MQIDQIFTPLDSQVLTAEKGTQEVVCEVNLTLRFRVWDRIKILCGRPIRCTFLMPVRRHHRTGILSSQIETSKVVI